MSTLNELLTKELQNEEFKNEYEAIQPELDIIRRRASEILTIEDIKILLAPVVSKYQIKSVSLFGSYARGEATAASDVDIIIEGGNYRGLFEYYDLIEELKQALGRDVDVITKESFAQHETRATKYFREQIERDIIRLI